MNNLYAVVVTYNRADFLQNLLESFGRLATPPQRIVVVDNASSDHTAQVVSRALEAGELPIQYERLPTNVGGSGGFCRGVELALEAGRRVVVAHGRRR
ncbi:glycosyltransferase [Pseudarthrobacter sp. So.54]